MSASGSASTDSTDDQADPPRPAGVRISWPELPEPIRDWVQTTLGAPVESAITQTGGFSPGVAARLVTRDGSRAFVKAVGSVLNLDSVGLHRKELAAMSALPVIPEAPGLIDGYDDGDWVALLMDDIDGRQPTLPWARTELDQALAAITTMSRRLIPAPWPGARPVEDEHATTFGHWRRLSAEPPADLDPWLADRLDALAEWERDTAVAMAGPSLIHLDVRADNMLLRPTGQVVLVDWAWACRGAAWVDVAMLLINVAQYGPHSPAELDALLAAHPLSRDVDLWSVTLLIIGLTGVLEARSRTPAPPGLPTIRAFQRHAAAGCRRWLRHRLDRTSGSLV
ncbi:MAG: aminoglycoside phosphotransferase family protein [Sporichthyaceae bacterium]|nr:aminoglycoside phosphotransferase family protein [Sporichthyaceae bacterium]